MLESRIGSFILIVILGVGLVLPACDASNPNDDIHMVDLTWGWARTDLALAETAEALADSTDYFAAFERYLRPERDFFAQFAQAELADPRRRDPVSEGRADSIVALRLGRVLADSAVRLVLDSVTHRFPPDYPFYDRLDPVLKRYHLLYPEVTLPEFRTHANGYDPSGVASLVDQVFITSEYFSLGLHYFLGEDFAFYSPNLPGYVRRRFQPAYIPVVVAGELAEGTVPSADPRNQPVLLERMIREGLRLALMKRMLPNTPDSLLLNYTAAQMNWLDRYENDVYKTMAGVLFESDYTQHRRYLEPRPFTSEISSEAPPQLGHYVGWQIVRAYLDRHPDVSIRDLIDAGDYREIYREARYKP